MTDVPGTHGVNGGYQFDARIALIGPIPPPVNGQSIVMSHLISKLALHFPRMLVLDTAEGQGSIKLLRPLASLRRSISAWWSIRDSDTVYIAVKAGKGMWLSSATAGLARLLGASVFLHHHSYAYARTRMPRMVALTCAAGPKARHIVLSRGMAMDLVRVMPEIHDPLIIGNACLIDRDLLDLPLKSDGSDIVLGHLSNLTIDKGIAEVIDLASALSKTNPQLKLIVGGPATDTESRLQLDRAVCALGDQFEYRGPLTGSAKLTFFNDVTHFIFPTRYAHEAMPLVLYEAMAAGAVCVATRQGSISEQLESSPSLLADTAVSFVEENLPMLIDATMPPGASLASRQAFLKALSESEEQLSGFVLLLAGRR